MPLQLPEGARFAKLSPDQALPFEFVNEIDDLIGKIAAQGERRALLEHFKGEFCAAIGAPHVWSSDEGWAYTDLHRTMHSAAQNPALFIQAFYDGCESLRDEEDLEVPSIEFFNDLLRGHNVPYEVRPPRLLNVKGTARVPTPAPPPTLAEEAAAVVQRSLQRAEELLASGRPREAVQEMLWILESIATAFRGVRLPNGTVQGRYFNQIAKELKAAAKGTTLALVVDWATQLQGYLSSPTGGGVRHGIDLKNGIALSTEEGRLFCNLILSYVGFLMAEHARLGD